jgi:hypothetical protein
MGDVLARIAENLAARIAGPLTFRLIIQPTVAAFFAIRAGLKDAQAGRVPYGWVILTDPATGETSSEKAGRTSRRSL